MPGGRPKGAMTKANREVREAAREYTEEALKALAKIMRRGKTEQAQTMAAIHLLNRGHGMPTQHLDAKVSLYEEMNPDEQRAFAAALEAIARDKGEDAEGPAPTHH